MSRPGRGDRRDDDGMSLLELTVGMMVFSVIAVVVAGVTVSSMNASRTIATRTTLAADSRIAMETVSRTLRVAVVPAREVSAITVAQPDALTFYALLNRTGSSNPMPTKVEYYRDAATNCLMQALTPARALTPATSTDPMYAWDTGRSTKCVVRTAQVPTASDPWFSYYSSGSITSGGSTVAPLAVGSGGLALTDRRDVLSIQVSLTVIDPTQPGIAGVSDLVRVTLGNVSLSNGGVA